MAGGCVGTESAFLFVEVEEEEVLFVARLAGRYFPIPVFVVFNGAGAGFEYHDPLPSSSYLF